MKSICAFSTGVLALVCTSVEVEGAETVDPDFRPELVSAGFTSRKIRPGDPFAMTLRFRNTGRAAAKADYRVFVHFEAPEASCTQIVIHADHAPDEPTSLWQPGEVVIDGPRILRAPVDRPEQTYHVHVGVYDFQGTGERLLDTYAAGTIEVTSSAPSADDLAPPALSPAEVERRRTALANRIPVGRRVSLKGKTWRFDLDPDGPAWALTDLTTGVLWTSDPQRDRIGEIALRRGTRTAVWRIDQIGNVKADDDAIRFEARPEVDGAPAGCVQFRITPNDEPAGVAIDYTSEPANGWEVTRVRVLDSALAVTETEAGTVYIPHRLGIERGTARGLPGREQWRTYDSLSMAMCGVVKQGSALLVSWSDVNTRLSVATEWPDAPRVPGRRLRTVSLDIEAADGGCGLYPLGPGGYVEIARAYRSCAEVQGWRQTWTQKRAKFPTVDRLFGAANFKPFVLSRVIPGSRFCKDGKERVHLGFRFEEVAACAEHWRHDLGIDRASVVLAGWINGGYDVRHPDVLPAAPECGGDVGLAGASRRIKACGYLFGMHDNYQDMYENASCWSHDWLNKNAQGKSKKGGNWNGGQAWQVCAIKQVELAARKDTNLPRIAELFAPSIYFIDTVFAWGLVTCEDPAHPMTRQDDLVWKSRLCMLAKKHFGLFGSEEGREWSVPCADYLEGIFGQQTDSKPGEVIPLFPLVYSDCVQIMTHQGNRIGPGDDKKMADHILFAEMHLPRFGKHLYWKKRGPNRLGLIALPPTVNPLPGRRFEITYRWRVKKAIPMDATLFVHFTHPAANHPEDIAYQNDHAPKPPMSQWQPGTVVEDGPFTVDVPDQFDGRAEIRLGLSHGGSRLVLADQPHRGGRYHVGSVTVTADGIRFEPAQSETVTELWSRADGGWGENLCVTDRVIKNTWEVLSPLNRLTATTPLSSHEFLTEDRRLQRTRFGDVTITVAYEHPADVGDNRIPPYGFIVESPTFVAFCANRYNGIEYPTPALFTARSLDGKPIADSAQVRVYHGFGEPRLRLAGREFSVPREKTVRITGEQ